MLLQNKKVMVTGAEGFIGSHLVEKLVEKGAKITALVQYNSFNNWGWLETFDKQILKEIEVITGDVREYDSISKAVKDKEIVFHLAALIAIPYSYQSPAAYVRTNVEGTLNVLEACRTYSVQKVIHTSTSEVYGSALYVPIDEKHPLQGQSPYSATKIGADKIAESYYRSFDLPVATIRPFNTFGPRQSARAIIPSVISQIIKGRKQIKTGNLSPTRDFNYVKDTVNGFIKTCESDNSVGHVINIGSGKEISIGQLINKIITLTNKEIEVIQDLNRLRPEKSEVKRLLADNRKAFELIGWEPAYDLDKGLKETIEWIERNIDFFKADIYNI